MKLPSWLAMIWKKQDSKAEIIQKIEEHRELTKRAGRAVDTAIAALDGETGWWSCSCSEKEKECKHDYSHRTP